mgnify:CR=1 FL=1
MSENVVKVAAARAAALTPGGVAPPGLTLAKARTWLFA